MKGQQEASFIVHLVKHFALRFLGISMLLKRSNYLIIDEVFVTILRPPG